MGIKTAIHEQNAYPGVTNKMLAGEVDAVMLTVPKASEYLQCKNEPIVTGLPVRQEILDADRDFARAEKNTENKTLIFSFGGSLGARAINNAVAELITKLYKDESLRFIHGYGQYGKWFPDTLKVNGIDLEKTKNIDAREYIYDMDKCLAAADIVICRAGASTLSEIEAVGRASILIPSPNVAENHQYYNAMALADNNAAVVIEEKDLTPERLYDEVKKLIDDKAQREKMEQNAKIMSVPDAQSKICDVILSLTE